MPESSAMAPEPSLITLNGFIAAGNVNENQPINTVVGTLATTGEEGTGATYTYFIKTYAGTDFAKFNISGNQLRTSQLLDHEVDDILTVVIQSNSSLGGGVEKTFAITVNDLNEPATNITLNNSAINENNALNAVVGNILAIDPDAGAISTYSLVTGTGSADNSSFNINDNQLRASVAFDFETKSSYSIRIRATDQGGLTFEKQFTISINDVAETSNSAPTNITLSASSISENNSVNAVIGTLTSADPDAGNTFTYSLVSGTGSTDNTSFNINGSQLRASVVFDYETKNIYTIRVRTTDQGGLSFEKQLTIIIDDVSEVVNLAPTNILSTELVLEENRAVNWIIGTLTTVDPNAGDTFTYSLVSGFGSADNASFNINGTQLRASMSFNFEIKNSYSIRMRTTDQGGLFFEKQFTITINNVNETPTNITLSASTIDENNAANAVIGTLGSTDPDAANTFSYSLVAGTGSTDNASFNINGSQLRASSTFNFESKNSYSIRIRTTDQGGLLFEKQFTIMVSNVNETPTDITLNVTSLNENNGINFNIAAINTVDPDASNTFTYTLVSGIGSIDNSSFNLNGNLLKASEVFDFETKSSYSIRLRATDQGGLFFEKQFTITINNVNESPTDISLSATAINENNIVNAIIGTLSSSDPDAGNTFSYTLVSGTGSADNTNFNINGTQLRASIVFDFETKNSHSIRIRTTDQNGLFFEKQFTIVINNISEDNIAPTVVSFGPANNATNVPVNVGSLTISLSEPIDGTASSGTLRLRTVGSNTIVQEFVIGTSAVTILGSSLTLNGVTTLSFETNYWVQNFATNIVDMAGNALLGWNDDATWNFTTSAEPDVTPPTIVTLSPTDNSSGVALDAVLTVTFSEDIVASTGTIGVRKITDNSIVINGNAISDTQIFSISGNTLSIDLGNFNTNAPTGGTDYFVEIFNNAVTDLAGNSFANGFNNNSTWNFSTAKENQTITFGQVPAKTFADAPFNVTATASSGLAVSFSSSNTAVATVSGNTLTIIGAGSTTITASQAGNSQYNAASSVQRTLTVNKANQTITIQPISSKLITDSPFAVVASTTSGLTLSYQILSGPAAISGTTITLSGTSGLVEVRVSQAGDSNYNPAGTTVVFNVTDPSKTDQTISIESIGDKLTTDAPFDVVASTTSGLPLTYDVNGPATINGNTITLTGTPGTVTVTVSQSGNGNFNAASADVSFDVIALESQTITFEPITPRTFGDPDFNLSASSSSGLAITFSSSNEAVATVEGNTVTILGAGTTAITASQPGDESFSEAISVTQTLVINKAQQTITFPVIEDQLLEDESVNSTVSASSGLPVTLSITDGPASINGGIITFIEPGSITVTATQPGNDNFLPAESISRSFTVTTVTGFSEGANKSKIAVYPNPTSSAIHLTGLQKDNIIQVVNISGQLMMEIQSNESHLTLDVTGYQQGMYIVQVNSSEGTQRLKFIRK